MIQKIKQGFSQGIGLFLGLCVSALFAYTVSGTIKTWTSGETLTAADLNTTVQSLKTAVESASQMQSIYPGALDGTHFTSYGGIINTFESYVEATNEIPMSRAGTVKNVRLIKSTNNCGQPITLVLRKNQVDTVVTTTIPAGAFSTTLLAQTVAFSAGDTLVWKASASSCTAYTSFGVAYEF